MNHLVEQAYNYIKNKTYTVAVMYHEGRLRFLKADSLPERVSPKLIGVYSQHVQVPWLIEDFKFMEVGE